MNNERKIRRMVRAAARASYGVAAVAGERWYERVAARLGIHAGGVAVSSDPELRVHVNVHLASGVPAAQVAANVAEAVDYTVQRDTGRKIDELKVTVDGIPFPTEPTQHRNGDGPSTEGEG